MKKAILLVAFGTTIPRARIALEKIEAGYQAAFPDWTIHLAYTSDIVRRRVRAKEGLYLDNPAAALAKLQAEGCNQVLVQSVHIFPGQEFHDLNNIVESFAGLRDTRGNGFFAQIALGAPLLYHYEDYLTVMEKCLPVPKEEDTALVLMGHGTEHFAFSTYGCFNDLLRHRYPNVFLATVEGYPTLQELKADLQGKNFKNLKLLPFMIVAGDHSLNDLAGQEENSWKSILEKEGYAVECILTGLGENPAVIDVFLQHTHNALKTLEK